MSNNSWHQDLMSSPSAGSALSNTTTQSSVLPGVAKYTLGANWFAKPGDKFHIMAGGKISTAASTPGTLAFFVMFGSIAVFAGGASSTLATSASNLTWDLDLHLIVQSLGSGTAATVLGRGKLITAALSAATPIQLLPASSPAAGTGFDSTVSFAIDLQAQWSVASASNSITCTDFELVSNT